MNPIIQFKTKNIKNQDILEWKTLDKQFYTHTHHGSIVAIATATAT